VLLVCKKYEGHSYVAAGFSQMLPSLLPHMNSPEELEKLKGMMVRLPPNLQLHACHAHCTALRTIPGKAANQSFIFYTSSALSLSCNDLGKPPCCELVR
jgi:hypothetical protein